MSPTMILLAGPNGAGKSTLYRTRVAPAFAGPFVNADLIQRDELHDPSPAAAYRAAEIAEARRREIMARRGDLATETVFSHPSKLELVERARGAGYAVWVMHVGVEDADISVARVAWRVAEGGHDVPEEKIRARYDRAGELIRAAVRRADMGLVYDNSVAGRPPKLILTYERGRLVKVRPDPPGWVRRTYAAELMPEARGQGRRARLALASTPCHMVRARPDPAPEPPCSTTRSSPTPRPTRTSSCTSARRPAPRWRRC